MVKEINLGKVGDDRLYVPAETFILNSWVEQQIHSFILIPVGVAFLLKSHIQSGKA